MSRRRYAPVGRPVAPQLRWWATTLTHTVGPVCAAREMALTRGTLAAVLAGLPVSATTEAHVQRARDRSRPRAA